MKTNSVKPVLALAVLAFVTVAHAADPYVDSWLTAHTSKYARIYTNDAMKASGTALTTCARCRPFAFSTSVSSKPSSIGM